MPNLRDDVLALLAGQPLARWPVFGGLPSLTAPGLSAAGVRYGEAHTDAAQMARAAASTYELFGFEAAVVPFDLCVEAEALGCTVDFHDGSEAFLPPSVDRPLAGDLVQEQLRVPERLEQAGRLPLVAEAIRRLKAGVGRRVTVGAWVPGPFTLAWQLLGTEAWLMAFQNAAWSGWLLSQLEQFIERVAVYYRAAGADFITVHEMGGSPQALGMRAFRMWVAPGLQRLFARLPSPTVLSVCGRTDNGVLDLAQCGADALNVDHLTDLARARQLLGPRAILLGNIDPVGVLSQGTPERVAQTVAAAIRAGATAIWPGCDLWPAIPEANFRSLMDSAQQALPGEPPGAGPD